MSAMAEYGMRVTPRLTKKT